MFAPVSYLSQNQVGRFIPTRELNEWHNKMKQMYPQVYPADDKLFGDDGKQHSFGTKLKTFLWGYHKTNGLRSGRIMLAN